MIPSIVVVGTESPILKGENMEVNHLFGELMQKPCTQVTPLSGGVTNITYKVQTADQSYAIRIPGNGTNEYINRPNEISNMEAASTLGFVPAIEYSNPDTGIVITQYIENNIPMCRDDIHNPERLRLICERLGGLHRSQIRFSNAFNIREQLREYQQLLNRLGAVYPDDLRCHMQKFERIVDDLFDSLDPGSLVPCHGDPKLNNFLLQDKKMWLIDWEYSGMAEYYFDLVNMVMTDDLNEEEEQILLQAYEICAGLPVDREKYLMYKIAADYLWIFWHLIKLHEGNMVAYNDMSWRKRLKRSLQSYALLEAK